MVFVERRIRSKDRYKGPLEYYQNHGQYRYPGHALFERIGDGGTGILEISAAEVIGYDGYEGCGKLEPYAFQETDVSPRNGEYRQRSRSEHGLCDDDLDGGLEYVAEFPLRGLESVRESYPQQFLESRFIQFYAEDPDADNSLVMIEQMAYVYGADHGTGDRTPGSAGDTKVHPVNEYRIEYRGSGVQQYRDL